MKKSIALLAFLAFLATALAASAQTNRPVRPPPNFMAGIHTNWNGLWQRQTNAPIITVAPQTFATLPLALSAVQSATASPFQTVTIFTRRIGTNTVYAVQVR